MMPRKLEFRAAQVRFNQLLDRVSRGEEFVITMRGKPIAKLEPTGDRSGKPTRSSDLVQFFARSPLRGSGIKIERIKGALRKIDL